MNIKKYEEQIARIICGLTPEVIAVGRMGRPSPDKSAYGTANRILDLGNPPIREILESCQYDKGYEAALARQVKGFTVGELVEKWEDGKVAELAEDQSLPDRPITERCMGKAYVERGRYKVGQNDMFTAGFRRIVR